MGRAWIAAGLLLVVGWTEARAQRDPGTYADSGRTVARIVRALRSAKSRQFRLVGNTSVVFRMSLRGEIDAAFKPQSRRHPGGHLAEVAAYRIGRGLGMDNVAPVVPRRVSADLLRRQLHPKDRARWPEIEADMVIDPDTGQVEGCAIYWIPRMRELGIDSERGIERWSRWLSQEGPAASRDKSRRLARQISDLVLFDYLIGNWDRWSGSNAQGNPDTGQLYVRDHNVAFYEPLPEMQLKRLVHRLKRVQRISRGFVERLKALDRERLNQLLHEDDDPPGYAPLSERQLESVMDRRRTLLSYIAALIDRYGEDRVLSFP